MKSIPSLFFFFSIIFFNFSVLGSEKWILNKDISTIKFELPIFLANNVKGEFNEIEGLIEIDLNKKINNKAIFSVDIKSIDMNYIKYKNLLLSNIFFDSKQFPKALVDTKKFSYKNEDIISLNVELTLKKITKSVPLTLEVIKLAEELVQIKGRLKFSRTAFQIGINQWSNTSILKDQAIIDVNLFLSKE
jgi:polyisoprenoid-binding protein YceI